jgi:hypothetical protein
MFFYRKPEISLFFIDILFHLFYSELIINTADQAVRKPFPLQRGCFYHGFQRL